jgi:hypothetical protein
VTEQSGQPDERMRRIAAGQLGEQLGAVVARIEAMTDDLAVLDRGEEGLSPEGRHIFERSGADGIRERLKTLEAERAEVAEHADRLRGE